MVNSVFIIVQMDAFIGIHMTKMEMAGNIVAIMGPIIIQKKDKVAFLTRDNRFLIHRSCLLGVEVKCENGIGKQSTVFYC